MKNRIFFALIGLSISAPACFAQSQSTAPVNTPPPPPPRNPILLPGDNAPAPLATFMAPPRPPAPAGAAMPPRPPMPAAPSMAVALEAAQTALARCRADGLTVGVAVADAGGNLLIGLMMDGANPGRIFMASRKNATTVIFRIPSSQVQTRLRAGDTAAQAMIAPNMAPVSGSVPLFAGERLVGAIAVSGASGAQDEVCAAAGAAAVKAKLI